MLNIVYTAAAIAVISMTVTKSVLFAKSRDYLGWRVLKCSYCFSHWLAFAFTPYALVKLGNSYTFSTDGCLTLIADFIIMSFALVCFASLFSICIDIFMERIDNGN